MTEQQRVKFSKTLYAGCIQAWLWVKVGSTQKPSHSYCNQIHSFVKMDCGIDCITEAQATERRYHLYRQQYRLKKMLICSVKHTRRILGNQG